MTPFPIKRIVVAALVTIAWLQTSMHAAPLSNLEETSVFTTASDQSSQTTLQPAEVPTVVAPHWLLHHGFTSQWLSPLPETFAFQPEGNQTFLNKLTVDGMAFETVPLIESVLSADQALTVSLKGQGLASMANTASLFRSAVRYDALLLQNNPTFQFSLTSLSPDPALLRSQLPGASAPSSQTSTYVLLVVGLASVLFFRRRLPSH